MYKDVGVLREATREWSPSLDLFAATTQVSLPTLPVGRVQPDPLRAGLSLRVYGGVFGTPTTSTQMVYRERAREVKTENIKETGR